MPSPSYSEGSLGDELPTTHRMRDNKDFKTESQSRYISSQRVDANSSGESLPMATTQSSALRDVISRSVAQGTTEYVHSEEDNGEVKKYLFKCVKLLCNCSFVFNDLFWFNCTL